VGDMGANPGPGKRYARKFGRFMVAYQGAARLDGVEAARLAGYKSPAKAFAQLRRTRRAELEEAELAFRERLTMDWPEVAEGIAAVARAEKHKDRLKALELLARIHGKLDPKLSIQFDRRTLETHIADVIAQLGQQVATDPQLAVGPALPKALPEPADSSGDS